MSEQMKFDETKATSEEFTQVVRGAADALHRRYWDVKFDELGGKSLNQYLGQYVYDTSKQILEGVFVKIWETCSNEATKEEIAKHVGQENKKAIAVSCAGLNTVVTIPAAQIVIEQLIGDLSYALYGTLRNANNADNDDALYATVKEVVNKAVEEGYAKGRSDIDAANAIVKRVVNQHN